MTTNSGELLLSLAWPNHQFQEAAIERLAGASTLWATCALTEVGFIRLSANPAVVGVEKSPADAATLLAMMTGDARHRYVEALPPATGIEFQEELDRILGHRQVVDAYLLGLAREIDGKLLTFDLRVLEMAGAEGWVEVLGE